MRTGYDEEASKDMPYTVVGYGHGKITSHSITLTGAGIKALAKQINEDDLVKIKNWSDISNEGESEKHYQRISILRKRH